MKFPACVLCFLCSAFLARGASTLVTFFDGSPGSSVNAPAYIVGGVSASKVIGRPGYETSFIKFGTSNWSQAFPTIAGGNTWLYFSSAPYDKDAASGDHVVPLASCNSRLGLTLTPDEGKSITYSSLSFDVISIGGISGAADTMNLCYNVYYKKNGESDYTAFFDQDLQTGPNTIGAYGVHSVPTQTIDISSLGTLDSSVEFVVAFAFYEPGGSGRGNRTIGVSNFNINGEVSAIPESSSAVWGLLGIACLGLRRGRRK